MMYKWVGDSNLFIPSRGTKIKRQEVFTLNERERKNSGVQRLIKENLIIKINEQEPTKRQKR